MRDLQSAASAGDNRAALAIEVFCRSIRKAIAAYAAVLGGMDAIVFTGGIGEHSAEIRANVCDGLAFLGVRLNEARNSMHGPEISDANSAVVVSVRRSEEDRQIARHCRTLLGQ
jgi:acetate kinase